MGGTGTGSDPASDGSRNGSDGPAPVPLTLTQLVGDARALIRSGHRSFLGITGAPGAGKSTLAEALATELGSDAALVGMDGFHLSDTELTRLGRLARKGASDTFDAAGYVNLLRRLQARTDAVVYAPVFNRGLEESIGSAAPVASRIPLIITEGNYLLAEGPEWGQVRGLLDACWYVEPGEDVREKRLVDRHLHFGRSLTEALDRTHGSDGRNAEVVGATRGRATRVIRVAELRTQESR